MRAGRWSRQGCRPAVATTERAFLAGAGCALAFLAGAGCADRAPAESEPCLVYLDFDGAALVRGEDDAPASRSELIGGEAGAAVISGFEPADFGALSGAEREAVVSAVTDRVRDLLADFAVEVTARRPEVDRFTMLVIGGNLSQLGDSQSHGLWGLAPIDCGNTNGSNVGFVFTEELAADLADPIHDIAALAVHELGHTFGLEHVDNPDSLMWPSLPNLACGWAGGPLASEQSRCRDGAHDQDDVALLLANLGRDLAAPPPIACAPW